MPTTTHARPARLSLVVSPETATATDEVVVEGNVYSLPYGMSLAVPVEPTVSAPIDLGAEDPKWAGYQIIVDLDLELGTQDALLAIGDTAKSEAERLEASYSFLERVLVAWNFSERTTTGQVVALPQPREGGVRRLRASQLKPIIAAINKTVVPDPNSSGR